MLDILIRNAFIIDGTGKPAFQGDIAVKDGIISHIGKLEGADADRIIEAEGRFVTPGFVDIHRHADLKVLSEDFGPAELCQGITTCISGNCGMSAAPCPIGTEDILYNYLEPCLGTAPTGISFNSFKDYADHISHTSLPLNMGYYVGNGTVRIAVKGFDPSPMTVGEMDKAKGLICEAMEDGAYGLSMGIMYAPECYYNSKELTDIAGVVGRKKGILVTHIRGEGDSLPASISEVISIAQKAEVPLHISHFKAAGRNNWGNSLYKAIELMENAQSKGQDVTCDVYPYEAGSTMLLSIIPPEFLVGGVEHALSILESKKGRDKLRVELGRKHEDWDNLVLSLGWGSVVISSAQLKCHNEYIGNSIAEIARRTSKDEIDVLCDLLISEKAKVGIVIFSMSPNDVREVIKLPYSFIVSDSIYPPAGNPHPRLYGSFPRVLAKYVMQDNLLSLESAINKMTQMPAARLGIKGAGILSAGLPADLLLFNPEQVKDTATYTNPKRLAQGMDLVLVAGKAAIELSMPTGNKNGHFLNKNF